MKLIKIYGLVLAGLLTASCSDFLSEYPGSAVPAENTYESYEDYKAHWMSVYTSLLNPNGFAEACRIYGDIQCDLACEVQGASTALKPLYRWTFNATDDVVTGIYFAMWKTIGRINDIFDHMDKFRSVVSRQDSLLMEELNGDLYFIRALCYSELVKYYCEAYDEGRAEEQLGMPICTTTHVGKPARASLKATYEFMYADLEEAENRMPHILLSDVQMGGNYFFTKECVQTLWARIALWKKDYDTAIEKATLAREYCVGLGMSLGVRGNFTEENLKVAEASYTALFRGQDYSPEVLFFEAMTAENIQGSVGGYFVMQPQLGVEKYRPEFVPSKYLLELYDEADYRSWLNFEKHVTDYSHGLRWQLLMKDSRNPELDKTSTPAYQTRPKLFRLSEAYLILAEAHALSEKGDLKEGIKALLMLQRSRIYGWQGNSSMSAEELFEEVKKERVRELCFEGSRLVDLKRWHQGFRRQRQPYTNVNTLSISADDPRFTWPIPEDELKVNSNIKPNKSN